MGRFSGRIAVVARRVGGFGLAVLKRSSRLSIGLHYISPGSLWENGYAESFNSRLRDELLGCEIFDDVRLFNQFRFVSQSQIPERRFQARVFDGNGRSGRRLATGLVVALVAEAGKVPKSNRHSDTNPGRPRLTGGETACVSVKLPRRDSNPN